ncbi:hypothetical protein [Spirillospora sp. CA-294931]|uniref:hypothetical protein n=1 Tax=Spirillospora sp. CA-294931 TaxID=3240042 RepID=UPI003D92FE0A
MAGKPGKRPDLSGLFRRDRLTGQIAFGLAGVLIVGAIVYGVGMASATYRLSDVGAWLSATGRGFVVHANGLAGKVDGKAELPQRVRGHRIKIVQDGSTVLLVDQDTGVVSRIDPSQLKVDQSRALGGIGLQVVAGAGAAYTVDPAKGTVQMIDPVNLAAIGAPARLTAPLGQAGMDSRGTLWVPEPQTGRLVPFLGGRQGTPNQVGAAGDQLALTIAAGIPVVTDSTAATAVIVRPEGTQKINLTPAARSGVKVPAVTDGQVVPILGADGALSLLHTGVGSVDSVALPVPRHRFEAPNILGSRVYLPDRTTGRLLIYNSASGGWERPVQAARPGGEIEVTVRDHILWVNDPGGATALAFDAGGAVKQIKKYEDKVPGGRRRPLPVQPQPGDEPGGQKPRNNDGRGGDRPKPQKPSPQPPPKKDPVASDSPGIPTTRVVKNGTVAVSFTPSAPRAGTSAPTGYVLWGANDAPMASATPAKIAPNGPAYRFTASGLACGPTHTFRVAAEYKDKNGRAAYQPSGAVQSLACTAPGAPRNLKAAPVNHGADLNWDAPPNADGVTYTVSWPGGSKDVTGTTTKVTGLANNATHRLTVTAKNGAGAAPADTSVNLAYPAKQFNNQNNNETNTIIRPGPRRSGETGKIPQNEIISMTVVCQITGESYTDTQSNTSSTTWNRVQTKYGNGYLNDTLVATPKGAMPAGGLFECENETQ